MFTEVILWVIGLLVFITAICLSVGLHEGGHMVVAKWCKLRVPEFFVGFGPRIFSFKKKNTEYGTRWIPLGGYVKIEDESQEEDSYERISLSYVHPLKRILVFLAGPVVNLILGVSLVIASIMMIPYLKATTEIGAVNTCVTQQSESPVACGASKAGITPTEKVVEVDGIKINEVEDIKEVIKGKDTVTVVTSSSNETKTYSNVEVTNNQIGITVTTEEAYRNIFQASTFIKGIVIQSFDAIAKIPETAPSVATSIVTGERDENAPGSVVMVGKTYGDITVTEEPIKDKVTNYMLITGLFNLSLGILNLLPILPLDGGRILIAIGDWFKMGFRKLQKKEYKPLGKKAFTIMSVTSTVIVFGFMVLLMASDFSLLFRGNL